MVEAQVSYNMNVFFDNFFQLHFGDFFVTHRGYMQDTPFAFARKNLSTFGILLADRVDGEFRLEIKHIKAVRRLIATSEFAD